MTMHTSLRGFAAGWRGLAAGWRGLAAGWMVVLCLSAAAQTRGTAGSDGTVTTAAPVVPESATSSSSGTLVDQVVAIVNGDLVLESDIDEERRFAAFQPYRNPSGGFDRDAAIERLIDRTLILEQARLQPDQVVTPAEAETQLLALRKDIPACAAAHCETDAGWTKFVGDHGFTVAELTERWRQRMETLKFVETRFRSGIRIAPEQIDGYYKKTLLPEYTRAHAAPPKLDTISERIQEVLLQEQVSNLLGDWLKTLKAQGTVRVIRPQEVQP